MTRERLRGLLIMGPLGLVAAFMFYEGLAGLIAFTGLVAARAERVVAYAGDVAVVPGAVVVLLIAAVEALRPPERWRMRLFGLALILFGCTIVLPIALMLFVGSVLSGSGYHQCPERTVGYTLPAAIYAMRPASCGVQ